jgi:hypothetical protein
MGIFLLILFHPWTDRSITRNISPNCRFYVQVDPTAFVNPSRLVGTDLSRRN